MKHGGRFSSLVEAVHARRKLSAPELVLWEGRVRGIGPRLRFISAQGKARFKRAHLEVCWRLTEGEEPRDHQFAWSRA